MRLATTLSTAVLLLAGVSAFSAEPPGTSCAGRGLPASVPTGGDGCFGANVRLEVDPSMDPETVLPAPALVAAHDDSRLAAGSEATVEAVTQVAFAEAARGGPPDLPAPEKLLCIDIFNPDCFMGCCAGPGQAHRWGKCVADCPDVAGGTCPQPDCAKACDERYCSPGPS